MKKAEREILQLMGKRVKEKRNELGLTQKKLGDMTGIANSNISRLETGKYNPTVITLNRLGLALNVPIYYFFAKD